MTLYVVCVCSSLRFLTVLPPIMLTFDLGTSSTHSSPPPSHDSHTQLYQMVVFVLSHPFFTKGSVMCGIVCFVAVYLVWLFRSTLRRQNANTAQGGGGAEGKGHLRSSSLKGHTQVNDRREGARERERERKRESERKREREWEREFFIFPVYHFYSVCV